jgi:hypothetical protein
MLSKQKCTKAKQTLKNNSDAVSCKTSDAHARFDGGGVRGYDIRPVSGKFSKNLSVNII